MMARRDLNNAGGIRGTCMRGSRGISAGKLGDRLCMDLPFYTTETKEAPSWREFLEGV